MDWDRHRTLSREWSNAIVGYAQAINAYVAKGMQDGWDAAGDEPKDERSDALALAVIDIVREANATAAWRELRERFPVAHAPFVPLLRERGQPIEHIVWIADDAVVATVGSAWQGGVAMRFDLDGDVVPVGVRGVGRTGEWIAVAGEHDVELRRGWDQAGTRRVSMPDGVLESIAPLADGSGALVVTTAGVFVSTDGEPRRLFPTDEDDDDREPEYAMIHAALSPDGSLVACGHQDSQHVVLGIGGEKLASFGPLGSEYPHHAAWWGDGSIAAFNSCHFYGGVTIGIATRDLRGLETDAYEADARMFALDEGMRVYSSAWLGDLFAFGDAYGYVHGVTTDGVEKWRHFVGSSVMSVACSPDGSKLAVGTAAGFLVLLDMRAGTMDRSGIGTAGFGELIRYVAWKGEQVWRW